MERIKRFMLTGLLIIAVQAGLKAQTWSEWFAQKKTQQKYLLEQLAALKMYAGYLQKGYQIGMDGLGFIKDVSHGEFKLHEAFFGVLKNVSPAIKKNAKVADIINMQLEINQAFSVMRNIDGVNLNNLEYLRMVKVQVMGDCEKDLVELLTIVLSDGLSLGDEERISRLDSVYRSIADKRTFVFNLATQWKKLAHDSTQDLKDIKNMEDLYEND